MGGRAPREKGFRFEREVVQAFKDAGLPARRFWGSNGRTAGLPEEVDVEAAHKRWQLKRLKKLPVLLDIPEKLDGYICRQDNSQAVAVVRLSYLIEILKELHGRPLIRDRDGSGGNGAGTNGQPGEQDRCRTEGPGPA